VRRTILLGVLLVVLPLGSAELGMGSAGRHALAESDTASALGKVHEATVWAREAAEGSLPGSPYAARGYQRLEALARTAEAEGRYADAAFAWRAMRSAAEATRPASAAQGRIEEAEAGMARATSLALPSLSGGAPKIEPSVLRRELETAGAPPPWLPSFFGWVILALLAGSAYRLLGSSAAETPV
jgi:hypothetical protein